MQKLYRVFTSNLKFFLPCLSADPRVTLTPLRTLHRLLQEAAEVKTDGTSGLMKSTPRGCAACKKIVGLDMVSQSWASFQEEPVDFDLQLQELLQVCVLCIYKGILFALIFFFLSRAE